MRRKDGLRDAAQGVVERQAPRGELASFATLREHPSAALSDSSTNMTPTSSWDPKNQLRGVALVSPVDGLDPQTGPRALHPPGSISVVLLCRLHRLSPKSVPAVACSYRRGQYWNGP